VQDVHVVLDEQLPVAAGVELLVGDLGQQARAVAADAVGERAQPRLHRFGAGLGVGEDHAAPCPDRARTQAPFRQVHAGELDLGLRHVAQLPEVPEVVRAHDAFAGVAGPFQQAHAPVPAQVVGAPNR